MVKAKNVYRAARGSGYFPLTFNFVFLRDGKYIQCAYCGIFIYYRKITRDHIYPKSLGGVLKAPACEKCNIAKESMLPIEWAKYSFRKNIDVATIPIGAEYLFSDNGDYREDLYTNLAQLFENLLDEMEQEEIIV